MEPSSVDLGIRKRRKLGHEEKEHVDIEEFATRVKHRVPARINKARENARAQVRHKKTRSVKTNPRPESGWYAVNIMSTERLQIDFDSRKMREIESLMERAGIATKKEFVNWALTLLKWAIKERSAGRIIASVDERNDSYKELEMPILSEVEPLDQRRSTGARAWELCWQSRRRYPGKDASASRKISLVGTLPHLPF
jgi:hypothetical protein